MMKRGLSGEAGVVVSDRVEHLFMFAALNARVAVLGQMKQPLGAGFQRLEDRLEQPDRGSQFPGAPIDSADTELIY